MMQPSRTRTRTIAYSPSSGSWRVRTGVALVHEEDVAARAKGNDDDKGPELDVARLWRRRRRRRRRAAALVAAVVVAAVVAAAVKATRSRARQRGRQRQGRAGGRGAASHRGARGRGSSTRHKGRRRCREWPAQERPREQGCHCCGRKCRGLAGRVVGVVWERMVDVGASKRGCFDLWCDFAVTKESSLALVAILARPSFNLLFHLPYSVSNLYANFHLICSYYGFGSPRSTACRKCSSSLASNWLQNMAKWPCCHRLWLDGFCLHI